MKISMVKRWKIKITKPMRCVGYHFQVGDVIENCYLLKACDGLYVDINDRTYNIPLDCFDIIKGE